MKRIQFRRMLAVIARMAMVLILVTLPTNGAQGQASQSSANSPAVIGWYSYTDPDFGWTIQYPADWTTEVLFENPPAQAEGVIRRRLALYAPDRATIWVDSSDNPARQSAESWFRLYKQSLLSSNPSETVVQKALLKG